MEFDQQRALREALSVESDNTDGQARVEREFTYYGKLVDHAQLEGAADHESQEQWSIRIDASEDRQYAGEIRVRKITNAQGETRYVLCTKTYKPTNKLDGKDEVEVEASADLFEHFKRLGSAGMIKTRYRFPREDGLVWEVDVYNPPAGVRSIIPWVKIDLEVPDNREAPTDFPIGLTDVINGDYTKRTDAEKQQVDYILKQFFVLPNQYRTEKVSTETYSEGPDSTITSNGVTYQLDPLFAKAAHEPVKSLPVADLSWILKEGPPLDPKRVNQADLRFPLLVTWGSGRWVVLDGAHRLTKAVQQGQENIDVKIIPASWLQPL